MKKKQKIVKKTKNIEKNKGFRKTRNYRNQNKMFNDYKKYRGGMDDSTNPNKLIRVEDVDYSFNIVIKNPAGIEHHQEITGKYSGPWKYDKPYQKGKIAVFNTNNQFVSTYEGSWIDGLPNGNGIATFANGNRYEGEYKDGVESGKGTKTYVNGNRYEGDFKNGTLNGNGILHLNDGSIYTGEFRNGTISGNGVLKYTNGNKYEGNFINNLKNGYGILKYANGDVYAGQWRDNLRYGIGTFITATRKYTGVWNNNEPSGDGQMKFLRTGVIINGIFVYLHPDEDDHISFKIEGTALYPDGSTYTGTFIDYEKIDGRANPPENSLASNDAYNIRVGFENNYKPVSITDTPFL